MSPLHGPVRGAVAAGLALGGFGAGAAAAQSVEGNGVARLSHGAADGGTSSSSST
jgi:hypothetical protein